MISAALDIQGERAHQPVGESSTASTPSAQSISVPGTRTLTPVASQNPNRKKVLFVTSEIADLVKTGGLGDVSAALPRAMARCQSALPARAAGSAKTGRDRFFLQIPTTRRPQADR